MSIPIVIRLVSLTCHYPTWNSGLTIILHLVTHSTKKCKQTISIVRKKVKNRKGGNSSDEDEEDDLTDDNTASANGDVTSSSSLSE